MLYALSDYPVSLVYSLILSFISFLYRYIYFIIIITLLIGEFPYNGRGLELRFFELCEQRLSKGEFR